MGTRSGLVSFCCVILAAALAGHWLSPGRTDTVVVIETVDSSVFDHVIVSGFTDEEAAAMRQALLPAFTGQCTEAFNSAGLRSPWEMAWETGIVIQYSRDLYVKEYADLRLVYPETREVYKYEFSTGRVQAATVPHVLFDTVLTADGRPHIFVHDSAFVGESFLLGTFPLDVVLTHELIHAGGQPPTPGWLGPLTHDLAGFDHYDEIMEACR